MKRNHLILLLIFLVLALACGLSFGDDDEREYSYRKWKPDFAPVTNALYQEDCGSCHFAYQPGLLPARSWQKIMSNLADHFGDNAELAKSTNQQILAYLTDNSADRINARRSRSIIRSISLNATPTRITDVPYIRHEHDEIPGRLITGNKQVGSLGHCDACHQTAKDGNYNEHQVKIPGVARWDD